MYRGIFLTAFIGAGLCAPLFSFAAVIFAQPTLTETMVASAPEVTPSGILNTETCYPYTVTTAGDIQDISYYQNIDTAHFSLVTFYNLTLGGGSRNLTYSWQYAPNNYVQGLGNGTGAMERYTLTTDNLRNYYGGPQVPHVEAGDEVLLCLGTYSIPGWFPQTYGASETLGDGINAYVLGNNTDNTCTENCNSNVLFLPGIQGSALKEGSDLRWPPSIWSQDVARLALDENGQSVNDIRVAGVLGDFYGAEIYSGFADFMDGLVSDGTIVAWEPFSYDWRLPLTQTVRDGVMRVGETDPDFLVQNIEELASSSRTGKVTIVAHSMGGLLGKLLIQKLEQEGKEDLVDSFIMVGSPELGTPLGVGALLHGTEQSIGWGLLVKGSVARTIAQNMESAYTLLPSREYFNAVQDPVITFDSNSAFTQTWRDRWGNSIDSYTEFQEFMTGAGVARTKPAQNDLDTPEILRTDLVSNVDTLHTSLDAYEFPVGIRVVQIVGWGRPTVKTVEYITKHGTEDSYVTRFTIEGDKTVVYRSADSSNVETYYFNLDSYRQLTNTTAEHRDMVGVAPVLDVISRVVGSQDIAGNQFITSTKPNAQNVADAILVSTRSPVLLGVRDAQGRFTGVNKNQDLSSETLLISEEIPGSTFIVSGGDQHVFLPESGAYDFELIGTDVGPATVEISNFANDTETRILTFTDILVSTSTVAEFLVDTQVPTETTIQLDTDADGVLDTSVVPDGYTAPLTLAELIAKLKVTIAGLSISEKLKAKLIKKVEKLEKKVEKQKRLKASKTLVRIERDIQRKVGKGKITDADANTILELLEKIEKTL